MTDERDYLERRWWALALLCMTQFMVVLDASIVNIALPSIGEDVGISQENLSWVVNGYVLTFGGFLLARRTPGRPARPAPRLHGRAHRGRGRLAVRGLRSQRGRADRGTGGTGPRRRDHRAECALDRHDDLPGRLGAQQGAGCLGGRRRLGRSRGGAARRGAHRRPRLGVGHVGERAGRADRARADSRADPREPLGIPDPPLRHRRRGDRHRRALAAGLRDRGCGERGLGLDEDASVCSPPRSACSASSPQSSCARMRRWCRSASSENARSPAPTRLG